MKPQDIIVLLKLATFRPDGWTNTALSESLGYSPSYVSQSLGRCEAAGLLNRDGKVLFRESLTEMLVYGVKYFFPAALGRAVKGIPTAHSAPVMGGRIVTGEDYVWPYYRGTMKGVAVAPIHESVIRIARKDAEMYGLLALVDAIRAGSVRERNLAVGLLKSSILKQ